MMKKIIIVLCLLVTSQLAQAADLLEVYRQALHSDPIYRSIVKGVLSSKEIYPQARAGLLPALSADALITRTKSIEDLLPNLRPNYFSTHSYLVRLIQPIFNYTNWMSFRRAKAVVKQANSTLRAAQQDLIVRTAAAYFNILGAKDNVRFTGAEKRAIFRQLDQAKQRYKVGLDAITSVYDAQASYDAVVADEITAKNALINNREELRKITGVFYKKIAPLKGRLQLLKPDPSNVELWVQSSTKYNNTLIAARYAVQAAKENIEINRGGHLPTASFVAEYQNRNPFLAGFSGHDDETASVGIALSIPVFQGGLVVSQTRQAKYDYQQALADLDATYRNSTVSTRQFYNNIISGISVIIADRQGVKSARSSEESNQAAYKVGTRTIIDVLLAQRQLYNRQRQLAFDQYQYINDILALKNAAGTLSAVDLELVNTWLNTPTAHTTMERFKKTKGQPIKTTQYSQQKTKALKTVAKKSKAKHRQAKKITKKRKS